MEGLLISMLFKQITFLNIISIIIENIKKARDNYLKQKYNYGNFRWESCIHLSRWSDKD